MLLKLVRHLVPVVILVGSILCAPGAKASYVGCTDDYDLCSDGTLMSLCSDYDDSIGCLNMWYTVHGRTYYCEGSCGGDCIDVAQAAALDCNGNYDGGDTCLSPCGGGCCDGKGECCNGGCLTEGEMCCARGACDDGWGCIHGMCVPIAAFDCGDGTSCMTGPCCNGGCLSEGQSCCGAGICQSGETCVEAQCVTAGSVACGDGTWCPVDTACASGKCCPNGFAFFDTQTGYCCGSGGLGSGICACAVSCGDYCCPGGAVCCTGGYCAPTAEGCPTCPVEAPEMCTDHTCAPQGATCCGGGFYCRNNLTCMACENGAPMCCGTTTTVASFSGSTVETSSTVPAESVGTSGNVYSAATPGAPEESSVTPKRPSPVEKAGGGCTAGAVPNGLPAVFGIIALMAICLILRRSRSV